MSVRSDTLEAFARLLKEQGEGLQGGVKALLTTVAPERAEVVRAAAIPRRFNQELLAVLVPRLAEEDLGARLDNLCRFAFIGNAGDSCVVHDEARRVLLGDWMRPENRALFREINARLRAFYEPASRSDPIHELGEAGVDFVLHGIGADTDEGFKLFQRAVIDARKVYALSTERSLLQAVQDFLPLLSPEQRLYVDYYGALIEVDRGDGRAASAVLKTIAESNDADQRLRALAEMRIGEIAYLEQRFENSGRHLMRAIDLADEAQLPWCDVLHPALVILANVCRETGQLSEAERLVRRSIEVATDVDDASMIARSYNAFGNLSRKRGDPAPALDFFEQGISVLESAGLEFPQARIFNNIALAHADRSEWEAALESLRRSLDLGRKAGDSRAQAQVLANMTRVYWAMNQDEQGIAVALEAIDLMQRVHDRLDAAEVKYTLAKHQLRHQHLPEANKYFTEASALFDAAGASAKARSVEEERRRVMAKRLPQGLSFLLSLLALVGTLTLAAIAVYLLVTFIITPIFKPHEAKQLNPGEVTQFEISADRDGTVCYKIPVPDGTSRVHVALSGAGSDLDLYAGRGSFDDFEDATWQSVTMEHNEELSIPWSESKPERGPHLYVFVHNAGDARTRGTIKVVVADD